MTKTVEELFNSIIKDGLNEIVVHEVAGLDTTHIQGGTVGFPTEKGRRYTVMVSSSLPAEMKKAVIARELASIEAAELSGPPTAETLQELIDALVAPQKAELAVSGVIIPDRPVAGGILVKATSVVWASIIEQLKDDWSKAYEIPARQWEEIIAGAYTKAGFDEVVLTPRSGDHGRDVIAIRKGVGCIKIIGSVKAYKPGLLVRYDEVRALLGVLSGELDTSKGIVTTTSGFPPNIMKDPFIAPFTPYRLELMDGDQLREWLIAIAANTKPTDIQS